jgi:hypothetical protein
MSRLAPPDCMRRQPQAGEVLHAKRNMPLVEISAQVRKGEGTVGRMVQDDSLYQDAQSALRGVDRAATGLEDQSPISVLGTLVTTLF